MLPSQRRSAIARRGEGVLSPPGGAKHARTATLLATVVLALMAPQFVPAAQRAAAQEAQPPDIVLILTDDQRWDTLDFMPTVRSELIDQGVTFSNYFVANSLCCPSRATILTGAYSHTHLIYTNGEGFNSEYGGYDDFDDSSTVATWLHDVGYQTALIGKYMNGFNASPVPPGWDHFISFAQDNGAYYGYDLTVNGQIESHDNAPEDYSTDLFAREAVEWIGAASPTEPLFLLLSPYAPHGIPIPADRHLNSFAGIADWRPPSYNERRVSDKPDYIKALTPWPTAKQETIDLNRQRALETLLAVDEMIEDVLQALADVDRLDTTLVLFTSDNGYHWGEHRWRSKLVPYEESIRVPLVIRYDPITASRHGTGIPALTSNVDLAPTMAELAGVSPTGVEGFSVVPLMDGTVASLRDAVLVEHLEFNAPNPDPPTYCAVRDLRLKYVYYATGEEELYGLVSDPYELRNHAAEPSWAERLSAMRARLLELCQPPPPGLVLPAP